MKRIFFLIGFILPLGVSAQSDKSEAYYRQALKKLDSVKLIPPDSIVIPGVKDLDNSPAAIEYLHMATVAAFRYDATHNADKDELKRRMEAIFGITFDSIQHLGSQFGDDYLVWLYARHLLSPGVQERYLLQRIEWYAKEEMLPQARRFLGDLRLYFPRSRHLGDARARVQVLESKVAAGKNNTHIVFRHPVQSLNELIAPYRGRVVYLDIWGTWCGPCREEMGYVPALKQNADTSKIVFVYLDMDEDENDLRWREYVQMHNIAGQHLRMNSHELETIWEALLHTSKTSRFYPSFFIFGRDGTLVEANAKRPSDKEALYEQLKEAADQP